nr:uncharacterized protein LOC103348008 isoform X2 [Oryctolagus cuniculus]
MASSLGTYKTQLYDPPMETYQPSPQWINLFVLVKDPKNKNLLAHQYGPQGSFSFTSQAPGEHQVCMHLESVRFSLSSEDKLSSQELPVSNTEWSYLSSDHGTPRTPAPVLMFWLPEQGQSPSQPFTWTCSWVNTPTKTWSLPPRTS